MYTIMKLANLLNQVYCLQCCQCNRSRATAAADLILIHVHSTPTLLHKLPRYSVKSTKMQQGVRRMVSTQPKFTNDQSSSSSIQTQIVQPDRYTSTIFAAICLITYSSPGLVFFYKTLILLSL